MTGASVAQGVSANGRLETCSRFAAAIFGGYVFAYGFVALVTVLGFSLGLPFFEAADLARMLGLVVYLCALLWAFAARSSKVAWLWLAGGGVFMALAGWACSKIMLA